MRKTYIECNQEDISDAFSLLRDTINETNEKNIEVNFGELDLINGKGIHELILTNEYANSLHKKLKFKVSKDVFDILKFIGMDSFLNIC